MSRKTTSTLRAEDLRRRVELRIDLGVGDDGAVRAEIFGDRVGPRVVGLRRGLERRSDIARIAYVGVSARLNPALLRRPLDRQRDRLEAARLRKGTAA